MAQTLIYHRHFHSLDKSINLPRFNQKLSSVYLQMESKCLVLLLDKIKICTGISFI